MGTRSARPLTIQLAQSLPTPMCTITQTVVTGRICRHPSSHIDPGQPDVSRFCRPRKRASRLNTAVFALIGALNFLLSPAQADAGVGVGPSVADSLLDKCVMCIT